MLVGFWVVATLGLGISSTAADFVPGELLVKLRPGTSRDAEDRLLESHNLSRQKEFRRPRKLASSRAARWRLVRIPATLGVDEAISRLKSDPRIESVEPNYIVTAEAIPSDASFASQWALRNRGQTGGTPDADIDAEEGWNYQRDSSSILIAVIDNDFAATHPDLAGNVWVNPGEIPGNNVDDDSNGYVDDINGYDFIDDHPNPAAPSGDSHGTHVAGIIGAVAHNGTGVAGVSWTARMMLLRGVDSGVAAAIEAVLYAIDNGAQITNNSYVDYFNSASLRDAFEDADEAGLLSVAAAGNDSADLDNDGPPEGWYGPAFYEFDSILSVANTTQDDVLASSTNYGAISVDLGAPGTEILSTVGDDDYGTKTGTSMAAPMVTGAAALVWAQNPTFTAAEVKERLLETVDPVASLVGKTVTEGRLNLGHALAQGASPPVDITHLIPLFASMLLAPPPSSCGFGWEIGPALVAVCLLRRRFRTH